MAISASILAASSVPTETLIGIIKGAVPTAGFDRLLVDHSALRMTQRIHFMQGSKELGMLEVECVGDLLSEVNRAKIMLMCG